MLARGVRSKTSRLIAVTIGKIMIASTTAPLKMVPVGVLELEERQRDVGQGALHRLEHGGKGVSPHTP